MRRQQIEASLELGQRAQVMRLNLDVFSRETMISMIRPIIINPSLPNQGIDL